MSAVERYAHDLRHTAPTTTLACWTDILGFGATLAECGWQLSHPKAKLLFDRLKAFARILPQWSVPIEESLIVNDGVIRTLQPHLYGQDSECHINIAYWLHCCILTHVIATRVEKESGLPGFRSIICEGETLTYGETLEPFPASTLVTPELVEVDEFSELDSPSSRGTASTKAAASNMDRQQERSARPWLLRPFSTQFNTALSKCYLADSLGSRIGLKRGGLYIEESLVNNLKLKREPDSNGPFVFLTGRCVFSNPAKYRAQVGEFHIRSNAWKDTGLVDDRTSWIEFGDRVNVSAKGIEFAVREVVAFSPQDEFSMFWFEPFTGQSHGYLLDAACSPSDIFVDPTDKDHAALWDLIHIFKGK